VPIEVSFDSQFVPEETGRRGFKAEPCFAITGVLDATIGETGVDAVNREARKYLWLIFVLSKAKSGAANYKNCRKNYLCIFPPVFERIFMNWLNLFCRGDQQMRVGRVWLSLDEAQNLAALLTGLGQRALTGKVFDDLLRGFLSDKRRQL